MVDARTCAFQKAQKALKKKGVTYDRVAQRLKEGLDAHETKAQLDKLGDWQYSKRLVSHGIRLTAVKLAAQLLDMEPAQKVEFPDEHGNPQKIGAALGDIERSARLIFLLEQAEKRAKEAAKCK